MSLSRAFALGPSVLVGSLVEIEIFLREEAAEATKQWPQYAGHFAGYRLGRATRTVRTKLGVAVEKGELVVFRDDVDPCDGRPTRTFWSRSNRVDTGVLAETISEVAR